MDESQPLFAGHSLKLKKHSLVKCCPGAVLIGHFRVPKTLTFKTRLGWRKTFVVTMSCIIYISQILVTRKPTGASK